METSLISGNSSLNISSQYQVGILKNVAISVTEIVLWVKIRNADN